MRRCLALVVIIDSFRYCEGIDHVSMDIARDIWRTFQAKPSGRDTRHPPENTVTRAAIRETARKRRR
jgi:hypothetical protein